MFTKASGCARNERFRDCVCVLEREQAARGVSKSEGIQNDAWKTRYSPIHTHTPTPTHPPTHPHIRWEIIAKYKAGRTILLVRSGAGSLVFVRESTSAFLGMFVAYCAVYFQLLLLCLTETSPCMYGAPCYHTNRVPFFSRSLSLSYIPTRFLPLFLSFADDALHGRGRSVGQQGRHHGRMFSPTDSKNPCGAYAPTQRTFAPRACRTSHIIILSLWNVGDKNLNRSAV